MGRGEGRSLYSARPICSSSGQETEGSAIREGKYFLDGLRLVCAGPLEPFGYLLSYTVVPHVSKIVRLSSRSYPLFAKLDPRLLSSPVSIRTARCERVSAIFAVACRRIQDGVASPPVSPCLTRIREIIADTRVPNYIAA